jgi:uncharacterized Zn-finger protein
VTQVLIFILQNLNGIKYITSFAIQYFLEIIGHLETIEGKNLGELVVVNRNKVRTKSKTQKSKIKRKHKFTCSYCGKGFLQRSKYIIHKSFHKTIRYECTECQNQFSTKENLALHQKTLSHVGEKINEINEVDKNIKNYPHKAINLELVNMVEPSTTIATSLTSLPNNDVKTLNTVESSELKDIGTENQEDACRLEELSQDSESKDTNNVFKCDKCNKHFQSKNNLEAHVKVVHQGEKPFICEICNKAFAYQSSLKGHKEIVHQVSLNLSYLLPQINNNIIYTKQYKMYQINYDIVIT